MGVFFMDTGSTGKSASLEVIILAQNCVDRLKSLRSLKSKDFDFNPEEYLSINLPKLDLIDPYSKITNCERNAQYHHVSLLNKLPQSPIKTTKSSGKNFKSNSLYSTSGEYLGHVNSTLSEMRRLHEQDLISQQPIPQKVHTNKSTLTQNYVTMLLQKRISQNESIKNVNPKSNSAISTVSRAIVEFHKRAFELLKKSNIKSILQARFKRKVLRQAMSSLGQTGENYNEIIQIPEIIELLKSRSDPIAKCVHDLVRRCQSLISDLDSEEFSLELCKNLDLKTSNLNGNQKSIKSSPSPPKEDRNQPVYKIIEEICLLEQQIVDVFVSVFFDDNWIYSGGDGKNHVPFSESLSGSVRLSIQTYFYSTSLAPSIIEHLSRESFVRNRDKTLAVACRNLSWEGLSVGLSLPLSVSSVVNKHLEQDFPMQLFTNDDEENFMSIAIAHLRTLPTLWTPMAKVSCLSRCCTALSTPKSHLQPPISDVDVTKNDVDVDEEDYKFKNRDKSKSSKVELKTGIQVSNEGSEELLLLMAYAIVCAQVPRLAAELTFVAEMIPEEIVSGEEGFVLATVETALDYVITQAEKLKVDKK